MSIMLSTSVLHWLQSNSDTSIERKLWDELTKEEKDTLAMVRESVLARQEEEIILKKNYKALEDKCLALEKLNAFWRGALDFFPIPIFIKNDESTYIFINRAYENIFDFSKDILLGKKVIDVTHISDVEKYRYQKEDEGLIKEQKTVHRQVQLDCSTGTKDCWYWSTGFKEVDFNRNGLIGTFVNITDLVKEANALTLQMRDIVEAKNQIEALVNRDPLTGLYNRLSMNNHFTNLIMQQQCYASPFSIIMFDVDHFKLINDEYGHLEGDYVLQKISNFISSCMRKNDICIRYGGEEFLLLLPQTDLQDAHDFAKCLCASFPKRIIKSNGGVVTASFGATQYIPGESIENIIHRVDTYLYRSKKNGRACVSFGS